MVRFWASIGLCAVVLAAGCSSSGSGAGGNAGEGGGGGQGGGGGASDPRYQDDPSFSPGVTYLSPVGPDSRGFLDLRGLIHEHSPHSHDACDDNPKDSEGNFDAECLVDFYEGLCISGHDFVMLTDHPTHFTEVPFPEALLYDASRGDQLIMRDERPVANWVPCDGEQMALVLAGSESDDIMPVGIEAHADDTSVYSRLDDESVSEIQALGGVVLVAHTEDHTGEELAALPIEGFEMYNLHANLVNALDDGTAVDAITSVLEPGETLYPDLVLLLILAEDPVYLEAWAGALALGARRVTTMGTDAHRNSLNFLLSDGERVDSWRRMNRWFSNHLLVPVNGDDRWDDTSLKEALRAGRLYGVFELLGYARGFDFHAEVGEQALEMGATASVGDGVTLRVALPSVRGVEDAEQPPRTLRILRATSDGWEEVAQGDHELSVPIDTPGAYRAEVRIRPEHLRDHLGSFTEVADSEYVWIYSNAIYVTE